jgi:hypothetical protein
MLYTIFSHIHLHKLYANQCMCINTRNDARTHRKSKQPNMLKIVKLMLEKHAPILMSTASVICFYFTVFLYILDINKKKTARNYNLRDMRIWINQCVIILTFLKLNILPKPNI